MQVVGNGERGRECFGGYVELYIVVLKALVWSLYFEDTWKYTLQFRSVSLDQKKSSL